MVASSEGARDLLWRELDSFFAVLIFSRRHQDGTVLAAHVQAAEDLVEGVGVAYRGSARTTLLRGSSPFVESQGLFFLGL